MNKKKRILWIGLPLSFFLILFAILLSTIYHASVSTSWEQGDMEKRKNQNAQQELSNLLFENDALSSALSSEQQKTAELERQLLSLAERYGSLEQSSNIQAILLDAHRLFDYGNYKEAKLKLQSLADSPLTESGLQVFNSVAKALIKKGYRINLR